MLSKDLVERLTQIRLRHSQPTDGELGTLAAAILQLAYDAGAPNPAMPVPAAGSATSHGETFAGGMAAMSSEAAASQQKLADAANRAFGVPPRT